MKYSVIYIFIFLIIVFASCETDITLDIPQPEPKIVVEGYIEIDLPPFISITRTIPFYGEIDINELDNFYVNNAFVEVSDGEATVVLQEFCLDELPPALQPLLAELLGVDLDSTGEYAFNACLYTVPDILTGAPAFKGVAGKSYSLLIISDEDTVTSVTTIPPIVELDSIFYKPASETDPANDSLVRLYGVITDPPALGNYYRYFTSRNNNDFYPDFNSVTDDLLFNGLTFEFTLNRALEPDEEFDANTYGYFWKGDTIGLRWTTIDFFSYDFWRTLESDSGSDGPFTSVTIAATNINGGLGIWCGYGTVYYELIVPL